MIINDAKKDLSVRQQLQDTGRRMVHSTVMDTTSQTNALKTLNSAQQSVLMRLGHAESVMDSSRAQASERISQMNAKDISNQYNMTVSEAQSLLDAIHENRCYDMARQYSSGTNAQAGWGIGGSGKGGGIGRLFSLLSGNAGASAHASNSQNFGDSNSTFDEVAYNKNNAIIENATRNV